MLSTYNLVINAKGDKDPQRNITVEDFQELCLSSGEVVDVKPLKASDRDKAREAIFKASRISPVEPKLPEVHTLAQVLQPSPGGKPLFRLELQPN